VHARERKTILREKMREGSAVGVTAERPAATYAAVN
jgi:hypothetical protein